MKFDDIINEVLESEGGSRITKDPLDAGGTTKYGISQRAYPKLDIEALTENRIGLRPLLGEGKPYGSSMKSKVGLLGPSASQIYNIFDIMYDVGGNKYNHYTARNVRRLIPFQNVWYLDWLFDDIEKGLR